MNTQKAFNNEMYFKNQIEAFKKRMSFSEPTFIEFGGKPFEDNHAARVLPGYDPFIKAKILKELGIVARIVMVVNALDILCPPEGRTENGRIRGDTGLRYDHETIRLIDKSNELGLKIDDVVMSVTPTNIELEENKLRVLDFKKSLSERNLELKIHYRIPNYPQTSVLDNAEPHFSKNARISNGSENIVVFSPGGGSGKFGVLLSEAWYLLEEGKSPNYIKFETFPVFNLHVNHPLNLAYSAATADLGNKVMPLENGKTGYDKDIENFELLKTLYSKFDIGNGSRVSKMSNSIDMAVNVIETGITDDTSVAEACKNEISRRLERYKKELYSDVERLKTITKTESILDRFNKLNPKTNQKSCFITIHGIDGTGKSTTVKRIVELLTKSNINALDYSDYEKEIKNPISIAKKEVITKCTPIEQFYYYLSSTLFHSRQIESLKKEGVSVIKDRYITDVNAHHSFLGVLQVEEISNAVPLLMPNLEVFLTIDESIRRERIKQRGVIDEKDLQEKNDFSRLGYFEKYLLKRAKQLGDSAIIIDTTNISPDEVAKQVVEKIISMQGNY